MNRSLRLSGLLGALLLSSGTVWAVTPPAPAGAPPPSLYERLGGYDGIARFVDTAFPKVAGHPQLQRLFRGHSMDSQLRQRQLIVDLFCQATGGPCVYIGRGMRAVHTGLGIGPGDWEAFIGVVRQVLEELNVAAEVSGDFLQLLDERFRPEVVEESP